MDRKLLEKAKEIEKIISDLEEIENTEDERLSFAARKSYDCMLPTYIVLPAEIKNDIMQLVRKCKMSYEKQLEEL